MMQQWAAQIPPVTAVQVFLVFSWILLVNGCPTRARLNNLQLWLYSIQQLNLHKSVGIVDKTKHCLLFVKDLSYHYAYRNKPFRPVKEGNHDIDIMIVE